MINFVTGKDNLWYIIERLENSEDNPISGPYISYDEALEWWDEWKPVYQSRKSNQGIRLATIDGELV